MSPCNNHGVGALVHHGVSLAACLGVRARSMFSDAEVFPAPSQNLASVFRSLPPYSTPYQPKCAARAPEPCKHTGILHGAGGTRRWKIVYGRTRILRVNLVRPNPPNRMLPPHSSKTPGRYITRAENRCRTEWRPERRSDAEQSGEQMQNRCRPERRTDTEQMQNRAEDRYRTDFHRSQSA